jgi:1,4-dihydroxy-6-naphthoate synthase
MASDKKEISIGFSPCPNDTFIFDALVNGRIDTGGLTFKPFLEDVETLNTLAQKEELDVTKLSFAAYAGLIDKYMLLTAGSALGNGVGPLLISLKEFSDPEKQIKSVAIPGKNTTAYFLFKMFYPGNYTIKEMIFSEIEQAVLNGKVDAGVIIHENRFTYEKKGLKKINDLGELWEKKTGQPIPLGGIAVKRNLDEELKKKINNLIRQSVEYAFAHPLESSEYVKLHAREMSEEVRKKHIQLYVNDFSVELGEKGKNAIMLLFQSVFDKNTSLKLFAI